MRKSIARASDANRFQDSFAGAVTLAKPAKPRRVAKPETAAPVPRLSEVLDLSETAGLPAQERAVVDAALAILKARFRRPMQVFDSPRLVKAFLRLQLSMKEFECFAVMFLDARCRLIAFEVMFRGSLTEVSVYPREVVIAALRHGAASVIVSHNHPSGSPSPSRADEFLTQSLKTALQTVSVLLNDHIVVGERDCVSFVECGLL